LIEYSNGKKVNFILKERERKEENIFVAQFLKMRHSSLSLPPDNHLVI